MTLNSTVNVDTPAENLKDIVRSGNGAGGQETCSTGQRELSGKEKTIDCYVILPKCHVWRNNISTSLTHFNIPEGKPAETASLNPSSISYKAGAKR